VSCLPRPAHLTRLPSWCAHPPDSSSCQPCRAALLVCPARPAYPPSLYNICLSARLSARLPVGLGFGLPPIMPPVSPDLSYFDYRLFIKLHILPNISTLSRAYLPTLPTLFTFCSRFSLFFSCFSHAATHLQCKYFLLYLRLPSFCQMSKSPYFSSPKTNFARKSSYFATPTWQNARLSKKIL
jgi:hypothetical protein